ncbi:MAG: tetratricopeptide repeat protein [Vampirovibrionales bacterium]|jgi:tetratricopeptide (TPR) repeat protein
MRLKINALILLSTLSCSSLAWAGVPIINPTVPKSVYTQAHAYIAEQALESDRLNEAVRYFRLAIQTAEAPHVFYEKIALIYMENNHPYQALTAWNQALETSPNDVDLLYPKALCLRELGQLELATKTLKQVIALSPKQGEYYFQLGLWFAEQSSFKASAEATAQAIALDYTPAMAYNNYGYALTHLGQYKKAEKAIDEALKREAPQENAATLDSKGYVFHKQAKYAEAIKWYDKALKVDPNISEIYLHKGESLEALGRLKEALEAYQTYIHLSESTLALEGVVKKADALRQRLQSTALQNP